MCAVAFVAHLSGAHQIILCSNEMFILRNIIYLLKKIYEKNYQETFYTR
jgi:hypothetical protein